MSRVQGSASRAPVQPRSRGRGGGAVRHTVCLVLLLCYRGKGCTFWMTSLLVATKH